MVPLFSNAPTQGSSSSFDYSALIGAGFSALGGIMVAMDDAAARQRLEEKIAKLSLAQKKELEIRLQDSKTEIEKMQILYQTLALDKNRIALSQMNKEKYFGIAILGASIVILSTVIIIVKLKKL